MNQRRLAPAGAALLAALAGPAFAEATDAARIRELEKKLERSLEMIEKLSEKISRLEQAGPRETPAKTAEQDAKIEQIQKHVSEIGAGLSRRSLDEGVALHGFADVGLRRIGENNPTTGKGRKGATLGTLDLYMTPSFGNVRTLIELAFHGDDAGMAEAEIERLQIGYTFNDAATGWIGRFHTPYGYWNTAYHHGAQIQTALTRPEFLEFEDDGGVLPAHTVGGWLTGVFSRESRRIGYDAYLGNAPQIQTASNQLTMRQRGSTSHRTSTGFNVWYEPAAVDGLRVGVHGLRADVVDDAAAPNRTLLRMAGGHATYIAEPWEILAEYYRIRNQDRSGTSGSHSSSAGYIQAGYNIGRWTPYARAERAKYDRSDNYFLGLEGGRSYRRALAGLRYDVDPKAALKVEFGSFRKEDLAGGLVDRFPELRLQYSVRF